MTLSTPQTSALKEIVPPSAAEIQEIAKQAYIYGFPMVDFYRILFGYFLYPKSPAYKTPLNKVYNTARVYTPADTTVQSPNSDTPYSFAGLDLRAEPLVLTLPPIEKDRYIPSSSSISTPLISPM